MATLAEIEQEFDIRIKAATEEQRPALELELERARAHYYREQSENQQIDIWKREAIAAYPHARPKEITGRTQEAIMAEAKASHDEVEKLIKDAADAQKKKDDEEAARNGWGSGTLGSGGGGSNRQIGHVSDEQQFEKDVTEFHDGLRRGTLTPQQAERGVKARVGTIAEYFTDPQAVEKARARRRAS